MANQVPRLLHAILPTLRIPQRSRRPPRIRIPTDVRKPWVTDVEPPVLIHVLHGGRLRPIIPRATEGRQVLQVERAGDERLDVLGCAPRLDVTPFGADLVVPRAVGIRRRDGSILPEGSVERSEVLVLRLAGCLLALALGAVPPDGIQNRVFGSGTVFVPCGRDDGRGGGSIGLEVGEVEGAGDVGAVVVEAGGVDFGVPVGGLPAVDVGEDVGEVLVVGYAAEAEGVLELLDGGGVVGEEDVVQHVDEGLGRLDAVRGSGRADGLKVLPVVVDGYCDSGGSDGSPEGVGVHDAQERSLSTGVGTTVNDPGRVGCSQIRINALELDVAGKVVDLSQCLLGGQESEIFESSVGVREALAVVTVLQNHTKTAGSFDDLMHNALLEERQAVVTEGLTAEQDEDRAAGLVV